jgi:DUF4097 and DUF4098 domain-containing protein YvlB
MRDRRYRPSLLGGLLWTGLGIIFLLRNFGIGPDVWSLAARYWPILLILLGLGKVIDYYRQKEGVSVRVGEIIGILFLVLIGTLITKATQSQMGRVFRELPISIGGTPVRPGEWFGTSYTYTEEKSYTLTAPAPVRIENSYGSVVVSPGSDQEVKVRIRKVVYQNDESRAKAIGAEIRVEAGPEGQAEAASFLVKTNRDALASKDYRFNTDLEVLVPPKTEVKVENSFGEVRVANLQGRLELGTTHNALEIRDCTGEFVASNHYGDSRFVNLTGNLTVDARGRVNAETIKGNVTVTDEFHPVEIRDVDGTLTVTNTESSVSVEKVSQPVVINARGSQVTVSDLGSSLKLATSHRRVQVSGVATDVDAETSYLSATIKDIKGKTAVRSNSDRLTFEDIGALDVRAQGTAVTASNVNGPVDIETTMRDVELSDFSAACKVANQFGDITLSPKTLGKGEISVKGRNGAIELYLPEGAAFEIQANARNGRVVSDYAGLLPAEAGPDMGTLKGKVKSGGPKIMLDSEYGNIQLRTRGTEKAENRSN